MEKTRDRKNEWCRMAGVLQKKMPLRIFRRAVHGLNEVRPTHTPETEHCLRPPPGICACTMGVSINTTLHCFCL